MLTVKVIKNLKIIGELTSWQLVSKGRTGPVRSRYLVPIGFLAVACGLVFGAQAAFAQSATDDPALLAEGQAVFEATCAGCHGADGMGTQQGRSLIDVAQQQPDRLVHIGIRHHDHMIFCAAKALNALTIRASARIDIFGNRRRADEADGHDIAMVQNTIDGLLIPVHDIKDTIRQTSLAHQFSEHYRDGRITLRRL